MQIKTTMGYRLTPIRMANVWNSDTTKYWQGCRATRTLTHICWECNMIEPLLKTISQFLRKLNTLLPYDPQIMLFGINLKELKTYVHTQIFTWMFKETLFIMARTRQQPRCPQ